MPPASAPDTLAAPADGAGDYSISLARANLLGVPLFLFLAALVVVPYALLWGWTHLFLAFNEFMRWRRFVPAIIAGTIVHEGLHGLGWILAGRLPRGSVRFGFNIRTITPYAHVTVPMQASAYRAGTVLPGIALGIVPALAGLAAEWGFSIIFAAFFLAAASGDFLCLWIMRKVPSDAWVTDHPTRAGCILAPGQQTGTAAPLAGP